MKVTIISTVPTAAIALAARDIKEEFGIPLELKEYSPRQIDEEAVEEMGFISDLQGSQAVFVDVRGSGRCADLVYESLKNESNTVVNLMAPMGKMMEITRLGSFSGKKLAGKIRPEEAREPEVVWKKIQMVEEAMQVAGKLVPLRPVRDARNYVRFARYWRYGGKDNYRNLLLLLLREYFKYSLPNAREPEAFPEFGIYHPCYGRFSDLEPFLQASGFDAEKPTVGILFYGNMHFDQCQPALKSLIKKLEDFNAIPVFSDGIHNLRAMRAFFFRDEKPVLDALVNLTWFRLNGGPMGGNPALTKELLKDLNVPIFTPACMYSREIDQWRRSDTGLSPIESIMAVIWPEIDGCTEPIPCCGVQEISVGGMKAQEVAAIDERVSKIATRIRRWVALKRKKNADKRLAIIIYNYPPGEENLGQASYLDVFKSVQRLLERLKEEGYQVELPKKALPDLFDDLGLFNSAVWHRDEDILKCNFGLELEEYRKFFDSLPEKMRADVAETWGPPPGKIMVTENRLTAPGVHLGNIFVGVQPARPPLGPEDLPKASHDKTRPPHHQYIAFYRWLEEVWQADAVVHVGTHGLAEFTKGKEIGLSGECFPDLLIGNMPHLYFYHVVNTSEVVIAKRRLYGTTIGYNSPPFTASGLYEGYAELEDLLDEHSQASVIDILRKERILDKISKKAAELNMQSREPERIHEELYEMKRRIIPKGLHVLGEMYSQEDLKSFFRFILRYDRDCCKSVNRILAQDIGLDYDYALKNRSLFIDRLEEIDRRSGSIAETCLERSLDESLYSSGLSSGSREDLRKTLIFGLHFIESYSNNSSEVEGLLRGMNMDFIEPASGGDVIRSPETLPTGRNLTQFDPSRIPTETAMDRGREIADNTIAAYLQKETRYPETVGVILWGFETTKTGGESVGQILSYLGVKVVRDAGSWSTRMEAVPLKELGRPRIDCLVNICGFFRDMFPNVMLLLDRAFRLAASLNEPEDMNFVRKHSQRNLDILRSSGISENMVHKMASGRIFGPKAGEYGTKMLPLIEDSIWKTEEELSEIFVQSMNHLYAENLHAVKSDVVYRNNLRRVEMVSQVRDTHDREIIDLDHYYEFFGGLSRAVQKENGKSPEMLISDTTEEVVRTEDVKAVISRGARTRLLNPRWALAMLEHDFHGAQQIADRVENMLGLAATTHGVEKWIWSAIAGRYIFDREMREKLTENNRYAAAKIAERLMEAEMRGYWKTTDKEHEMLRQAALGMEGIIEDRNNRG